MASAAASGGKASSEDGPAGGAADAGEKTSTRILLIGVNPDHPHGTHMYIHAARLLAC
jgi:hypothetical protein